MKGLLFLWQEKHICDICCDPLDTCFAKKRYYMLISNKEYLIDLM